MLFLFSCLFGKLVESFTHLLLFWDTLDIKLSRFKVRAVFKVLPLPIVSLMGHLNSKNESNTTFSWLLYVVKKIANLALPSACQSPPEWHLEIPCDNSRYLRSAAHFIRWHFPIMILAFFVFFFFPALGLFYVVIEKIFLKNSSNVVHWKLDIFIYTHIYSTVFNFSIHYLKFLRVWVNRKIWLTRIRYS